MRTTQERLDYYIALEEQIVLRGQAYTADGLQMTRADLGKVEEIIRSLKKDLAQETRSAIARGGLAYGVPGS